jgi:hypothetical protein
MSFENGVASKSMAAQQAAKQWIIVKARAAA